MHARKHSNEISVKMRVLRARNTVKFVCVCLYTCVGECRSLSLLFSIFLSSAFPSFLFFPDGLELSVPCVRGCGEWSQVEQRRAKGLAWRRVDWLAGCMK